MLRMYVAQQCFGLSDEGVEDALYDSQAIRRFVGIDLAREAAPDATTLLKFRRLLETHQLTESIFNAINAHLAEKGLLLREGTIVDATLIAAPPSTKNQEGKRDERDASGEERQSVAFRHEGAYRRRCPVRLGAYGDRHRRQRERRDPGPGAPARGRNRCLWRCGLPGGREAGRESGTPGDLACGHAPGKRKALPGTPLGDLLERIEHTKASIRAKVEHPFHVVKNLFRHRKTRYQGLAKNTAQLFSLFGFANLVLARRWLSTPTAKLRPEGGKRQKTPSKLDGVLLK